MQLQSTVCSHIRTWSLRVVAASADADELEVEVTIEPEPAFIVGSPEDPCPAMPEAEGAIATPENGAPATATENSHLSSSASAHIAETPSPHADSKNCPLRDVFSRRIAASGNAAWTMDRAVLFGATVPSGGCTSQATVGRPADSVATRGTESDTDAMMPPPFLVTLQVPLELATRGHRDHDLIAGKL